MSFVSNIIQGLQGISRIDEGTDLQVQGANSRAAIFRSAQQQVKTEANYNIAIERFNRNRELDSLSRDFDNFFSAQRSQMAATGVGLSSKSFLAVANETQSAFERDLLRLRNTSKLTEQKIQFKAKSQIAGFENEARTAEYEGRVAQAKGDAASSKAMFDMFVNVASGFSSL